MDDNFLLDAFDYELPSAQIAQQPVPQRGQSRLLVLDCGSVGLSHRRFADIVDYLQPEDLLVVNDSRVFPARLLGCKPSGGKVELLLLHYPVPVAEGGQPTAPWRAAEALGLLKCSKRPKPGAILVFGERLRAEVLALHEDGKVRVVLHYWPHLDATLDDVLAHYGQMPLPPYISRPEGTTADDAQRYQTSYARRIGSVAAPTAGLHFSDELLATIRARGTRTCAVTLHVGYGTFAPVRARDIRHHAIHAEHIEVAAATADLVNETRRNGGRIWAVGTTTVRALEAATDAQGLVRAHQGLCQLFIYPGYRFRTVDNVITNFHLPRSSLLFLVAALAGRERIMSCYQEAVRLGYRFFSYGDAMAIIVKAPAGKTAVL